MKWFLLFNDFLISNTVILVLLFYENVRQEAYGNI